MFVYDPQYLPTPIWNLCFSWRQLRLLWIQSQLDCKRPFYRRRVGILSGAGDFPTWNNGLLDSWFLGFRFLGFWFLAFRVSGFLGFKDSTNSLMFFERCLVNITKLPFHVFDRYWYDIKNVQTVVKRIFTICRRPCFPILSNEWSSGVLRFRTIRCF